MRSLAGGSAGIWATGSNGGGRGSVGAAGAASVSRREPLFALVLACVLLVRRGRGCGPDLTPPRSASDGDGRVGAALGIGERRPALDAGLVTGEAVPEADRGRLSCFSGVSGLLRRARGAGRARGAARREAVGDAMLLDEVEVPAPSAAAAGGRGGSGRRPLGVRGVAGGERTADFASSAQRSRCNARSLALARAGAVSPFPARRFASARPPRGAGGRGWGLAFVRGHTGRVGVTVSTSGRRGGSRTTPSWARFASMAPPFGPVGRRRVFRLSRKTMFGLCDDDRKPGGCAGAHPSPPAGRPARSTSGARLPTTR